MKKFKIVLIALVALILIMIAILFGCTTHYMNRIGRVGDHLETVPPEQEDFITDVNNGLDEIDPEDVQWLDPNSMEPLGDEDLLNILLVGQDKRPGENRQRSDAMIVCSVNTKTKQVSLISFLRDLYVQIPGYTDNRLNAAYAFGGYPLLADTLYLNFGITIDGFFEVDFNGFVSLIDKIGGINVPLTAEEAKILGNHTYEGLNHMDGKQALSYARLRKIGTDFGRTKRQRTILMAAFERVKKRSLPELLKLLDQTLPYITTNMTNTEIYTLATKLFPMVRSAKVSAYYVPQPGAYTNVYIRQMAVLFPDLYAIRYALRNEYLPLSQPEDEQ